ncbi:type IV peptidase, partial [Streptomyces coelicoflavus ZG0656]
MSTDLGIGGDTGIDLDVVVVLVAALWGAATGAQLPRAAYRFSAPAGEAWHEHCPEGHPVRGWLGRARCGRCPTGRASYGPRTASLARATALVCAALAAATGTR